MVAGPLTVHDNHINITNIQTLFAAEPQLSVWSPTVIVNQNHFYDCHQ